MLLLRIGVAAVFIAHAVVRVSNGTIPQFADFLAAKSFPLSYLTVWLITIFEIAGGTLLALGYFTRILCAGFIFLLVIGIVLIHADLGWFNGEHGTGGMEYSFTLILALIAVAASKTGSR